MTALEISSHRAMHMHKGKPLTGIEPSEILEKKYADECRVLHEEFTNIVDDLNDPYPFEDLRKRCEAFLHTLKTTYCVIDLYQKKMTWSEVHDVPDEQKNRQMHHLKNGKMRRVIF